jgi:hypothetical protein
VTTFAVQPQKKKGAHTMMVPPADFGISEPGNCVMASPGSNISPNSSALGPCYLYVPITLPAGTSVDNIDVTYFHVDQACLLQTSFRSVTFNDDHTLADNLIDSKTISGTSTGVASSSLMGTTIEPATTYQLELKLSGANRCFVYGVEVTY